MFRLSLRLIALSLTLIFSQAKEEAKPPLVVEVAQTEAIAAQLGQWVTVRGQVTRTGRSKTNMQFLNFANLKFVVVCFPEVLPLFDKGEPADLYKDKWIEITGTIEQYKTQYQIKLTTPDQVKVIPDPKQPDAAAPEKAQDKVPSTPTLPPDGEKKSPVDAKKFFDC